MYTEMKDFLGKTFTKITVGHDTIDFVTDSNEQYRMYHSQECCESVTVEDVCGNVDDLIGSPIVLAEEVTNRGTEGGNSYTWTFYKLATVKGTVTIRWYGESDGYYSESVELVRL